MKVLILTQYFWPEGFRINDLAVGLIERGHEVSVLTGLPNYPNGRFFEGYGWQGPYSQRWGEVDIRRTPLIPRGKGTGARLALNYLSFALTASVAGPFRYKDDFDVIFVYEPSPITIGVPASVIRRRKRVPLVFWVQDLWPEILVGTGAITSPRILDRVAKLARWIYSRCDVICVPSLGFASAIERLGISRGRIEYVPNWAESIYQPGSIPNRDEPLPALPNGFRLMFAGNIGVSQSFETIIEAAVKLKSYPDLHWVIVGDGRRKEWVEQQIKEQGLEETVHLLGQFPVEAMPQLLGQADALLVTLGRELIYELTIPSKVQSYLACAKPIVAAIDGEGARVVQDSGAGLTVPAQDAEGLADSVLSVYEMPQEERGAMGEHGRRYFEENFLREKIIDQLESLLIQAASKGWVTSKYPAGALAKGTDGSAQSDR